VSIEMNPIGCVSTDTEKVLRSWIASDVEGVLVVDEAYKEGLGDIEPGQRIVIIFNFHESPAFSPDLLRQMPPHRRQGPPGVDSSMGIFSICSPVRPSPIGVSVLEVPEVEGNVVRVGGLSKRVGTPILDLTQALPSEKQPQLPRVRKARRDRCLGERCRRRRSSRARQAQRLSAFSPQQS
jgi:tRNA (Thr-GGU) A37 N-methylase